MTETEHRKTDSGRGGGGSKGNNNNNNNSGNSGNSGNNNSGNNNSGNNGGGGGNRRRGGGGGGGGGKGGRGGGRNRGKGGGGNADNNQKDKAVTEGKANKAKANPDAGKTAPANAGANAGANNSQAKANKKGNNNNNNRRRRNNKDKDKGKDKESQKDNQKEKDKGKDKDNQKEKTKKEKDNKSGGGGSASNTNKNKNTGKKKKKVDEAALQKEKEAKAAALAEKNRLEAEAKAEKAAKEAKLEEQKDLQSRAGEAYRNLSAFVEASGQRKTNRAKFAAESLVLLRKEFESNKKSLKSDLKKCTAFVKKIKSGAAWSMKPADIIKDVSGLNLTRYVEEVVAALLDAKLKLVDIPVVLALCSVMHQRYDPFMLILVPKMWATVAAKPTEETAKLRRIYLRLLTEFLLNGLISETKQLLKTVAEVTGGSTGNYAVTDANLVVAFVKAAGPDILGIKPRSITADVSLLLKESERREECNASGGLTPETLPEDCKSEDIPVVISDALAKTGKDIAVAAEETLTERAVTPAITEVLADHCKGAYRTLTKSLVETHLRLQKLEKRCEQDRLVAGSLTEAREKGLADARKLLDSLVKSVETMSDVLDVDKPELAEEKEEAAGEGTGVGVGLWTKEGDDGQEDFGPFDDEESRSFYCDVPDLVTTIPPALLGLTPEQIDQQKDSNLIKYGTDTETVEDDAGTDETETPASDFAETSGEEGSFEEDDEEQELEGAGATTQTNGENGLLETKMLDSLHSCIGGGPFLLVVADRTRSEPRH